MQKQMEINEQNTRAGYVAIIGKPNAGKSTLMNTLVGAKLSIVTPKPQTTRKRVLGIYSDKSNQIVFLDTPGLLKPKYEMHATMMRYVDESVAESDAIVVLVDMSKYDLSRSYFPSKFFEMLKNAGKPSIALLNKIDLIKDKKMLLPAIQYLHETKLFTDIIPISALEEEDARKLIDNLIKLLPEGPFFYDDELLSTQTQRFFVSEMIRETIFELLEEELPYSTDVNIVEFKEREEGKWYISAEVYVERATQKGIIIGKGGAMLKTIGEKSRMKIEDHLDMPVYLELFIKVRDKWRSNPTILKHLGY